MLDVRDPAAIAAFRDSVGGVDVLFNCAGFVDHGTILDCDEEQWAFSIDLNMTAMYRMMRAFLPGMIAKGVGFDHQHGLGRLLDHRRARTGSSTARPRPGSSA